VTPATLQCGYSDTPTSTSTASAASRWTLLYKPDTPMVHRVKLLLSVWDVQSSTQVRRRNKLGLAITHC
jgi:hypothetical protein